VVQNLRRTSYASYIPWNKGYWKGNILSVYKYDNDNDKKAYRLNSIQSELLYNATQYLQPSADPQLNCSILVKHTNMEGYDLVSIPCHLKLSKVMAVCMYYNLEDAKAVSNRRFLLDDRNHYGFHNNSLLLIPTKTCSTGWFYIASYDSCVKLKKLLINSPSEMSNKEMSELCIVDNSTILDVNDPKDIITTPLTEHFKQMKRFSGIVQFGILVLY